MYFQRLNRRRFLSALPASLALAAGPRALRAAARDDESRRGTTVQLPTFGVAVDADGVLSVKAFPDPTGRLRAARIAAARRGLDDETRATTKLRKISLVRLERALQRRLSTGREPDDTMRHLAGLQRMQFAFCYPAAKDIVVAGPAEGWLQDPSGRSVGISNGRPVILLEDLLTALRAYLPGSREKRFIGCTIEPRPEGLARLVEFQRTIPRMVPQRGRDVAAARIAEGMHNSLGMANIRVFGVPDQTHLAQLLVEADYRMKRIGTGLEPPPVKMATFFSAVRSARHETLHRWWFVPNYDCVKVTDDRMGMELVGDGVQLLGEDKLIGADGSLPTTRAKPNKASELYTLAFTRKFSEIATASPVFAQLRNMIDLVVAAAFLCRDGYYGKAETRLGLLADESQLPIETLAAPRAVRCAVNSVWKGNRLFTAAGGGVSIHPEQAFTEDRLMADPDGSLATSQRQVGVLPPGDRWWWD
jgi:hypothetical protein